MLVRMVVGVSVSVLLSGCVLTTPEVTNIALDEDMFFAPHIAPRAFLSVTGSVDPSKAREIAAASPAMLVRIDRTGSESPTFADFQTIGGEFADNVAAIAEPAVGAGGSRTRLNLRVDAGGMYGLGPARAAASVEVDYVLEVDSGGENRRFDLKYRISPWGLFARFLESTRRSDGRCLLVLFPSRVCAPKECKVVASIDAANAISIPPFLDSDGGFASAVTESYQDQFVLRGFRGAGEVRRLLRADEAEMFVGVPDNEQRPVKHGENVQPHELVLLGPDGFRYRLSDAYADHLDMERVRFDYPEGSAGVQRDVVTHLLDRLASADQRIEAVLGEIAAVKTSTIDLHAEVERLAADDALIREETADLHRRDQRLELAIARVAADVASISTDLKLLREPVMVRSQTRNAPSGVKGQIYCYLAMAGTELRLGVGRWELWGYVHFANGNGASVNYHFVRGLLTERVASDDANQPPVWKPTGRDSKMPPLYASEYISYYADKTLVLPAEIVNVTEPTTVFLTPMFRAGEASGAPFGSENAIITATLYARRLLSE